MRTDGHQVGSRLGRWRGVWLSLWAVVALSGCVDSVGMLDGPGSVVEEPKTVVTLSSGDEVALFEGDLLFECDTAGMGAAVEASTGRFTHVAVVVRQGDQLLVAEATPRRGVALRSVEEFMAEGGWVQPMWVAVEYERDSVSPRVLRLVGRPYDFYFAVGTERLYCSELVVECYRLKGGAPLFEQQPMNFLDADGQLPRYWARLFDSLGCAVPQGQLGSNPDALAHSACLRPVGGPIAVGERAEGGRQHAEGAEFDNNK